MLCCYLEIGRDGVKLDLLYFNTVSTPKREINLFNHESEAVKWTICLNRVGNTCARHIARFCYSINIMPSPGSCIIAFYNEGFQGLRTTKVVPIGIGERVNGHAIKQIICLRFLRIYIAYPWAEVGRIAPLTVYILIRRNPTLAC